MRITLTEASHNISDMLVKQRSKESFFYSFVAASTVLVNVPRYETEGLSHFYGEPVTRWCFAEHVPPKNIALADRVRECGEDTRTYKTPFWRSPCGLGSVTGTWDSATECPYHPPEGKSATMNCLIRVIAMTLLLRLAAPSAALLCTTLPTTNVYHASFRN